MFIVIAILLYLWLGHDSKTLSHYSLIGDLLNKRKKNRTISPFKHTHVDECMTFQHILYLRPHKHHVVNFTISGERERDLFRSDEKACLSRGTPSGIHVPIQFLVCEMYYTFLFVPYIDKRTNVPATQKKKKQKKTDLCFFFFFLKQGTFVLGVGV